MAKQGFKTRGGSGTALEGVNGITVSTPQALEINSSSGQLGAGQVLSYTPILTFGGGSTGIGYATQTGFYYRIGKIVWFSLQITLTSKGSSTGTALVTLPLTANSLSMRPFMSFDVLTFVANTFISPVIQPGTNTVEFEREISGANHISLTNSEFANNSSIVVTGCYNIP